MIVEYYLPEMVLASNKHYILGYKKGKLILRDKKNKKIIKQKRIEQFYKSFTWIERLLRLTPRAAVSVSDTEFIYSHHGVIYLYDCASNEIKKEHEFSRGMNNPLSFCIRRDNEGKVKSILYGEYIWNESKGPVAIYCRENMEWKKVYEFASNTITHIHNIVYDSIGSRYLILTGDQDTESAIWEADLCFQRVIPLVRGLQKYRACVAFATDKGIIYATDTPLEKNALFCLDRNNKVVKICDMPGPCIYGKLFQDALYFSTSVEGDAAMSKWAYRLSNKLGNGVSDYYSHIIMYDVNGNVKEIYKNKKDCLPMWLFQFGNILFSNSSEELLIYHQSCKAKGTYIIFEE